MESYSQSINQETIQPLLAMTNKSALMISYLNNLNNTSNDLAAEFDTLRSRISMDIFRSSTGIPTGRQDIPPSSRLAADAINSVNRTVNSLWISNEKVNKVSQQLQNLSNIVNATMEQLRKDSHELNNTQIGLEQKGRAIAERLSQIETPIGKLPFGITESVMLFPLSLGIGFLICSSLLNDVIALRKEFHERCRKYDPNQKILTDKKVAIVAPLWIDPVSSIQNKTLKIITISLPFFIFVLSWYLTSEYILDFSGIDNPLFINIESEESIYDYLNILSLVLFISGYWIIIIRLRQYGMRNKRMSEDKVDTLK